MTGRSVVSGSSKLHHACCVGLEGLPCAAIDHLTRTHSYKRLPQSLRGTIRAALCVYQEGCFSLSPLPPCFGSLQRVQMQVPYISSFSSAETLISSSITLLSCHQTIDLGTTGMLVKKWSWRCRQRTGGPSAVCADTALSLTNSLTLRISIPSSSLRCCRVRRRSQKASESIHTATLEIEDKDTLAGILNEQLRVYFCTVLFEHWIQKALGLSPGSIMSVEMLFFRLNSRFRRFIFNLPDSAEVQEKYQRIAKVIWLRLFIGSKLTPAQILKENPFAFVIFSACDYTTHWPTVDFTFILNPFLEVLSQQEPVSRIMQQLGPPDHINRLSAGWLTG